MIDELLGSCRGFKRFILISMHHHTQLQACMNELVLLSFAVVRLITPFVIILFLYFILPLKSREIGRFQCNVSKRVSTPGFVFAKDKKKI